MDENKIIGKLGMDDKEGAEVKEPIFITLSSFNKYKYIDIRKYYSDNGEWKPTKKGVTMNLSQVDNFIEIIKNNRSDIEEWFK